MTEEADNTEVEPIRYRNDKINAAIGKLRLTNQAVADRATDILKRWGKADPRGPMALKTVAAIRDGDPNVGLTTLAAVVEAVGETMHSVFQPLEESEKAA